MDRQKKFLLFGAAWVSALLLTWFYYHNAVAPQQEKTLRMVVATRDMPVGTLLKKSDLKLVNYPERQVPKGSIFQIASAENRVLMMPLNTNEPVLQWQAVRHDDRGRRLVHHRPRLPRRQRAGHRCQRRRRADPARFARGRALHAARLHGRGHHIHHPAERQGDLHRAHRGRSDRPLDPRAPKSPIVTLILLPADAQKLELAKNQGKISLSLRNPLDSAQAANTEPVTTEVLDPMISARLARARRGRTTNVARANLEDPKVWQELTGEKKLADPAKAAAEEEARRKKAEAEKPRVVVDVYRGDKHVQESFK